MPRDISWLERFEERLIKEGNYLTKKQIEEINEMAYSTPQKQQKEYKEENIMKAHSELKKDKETGKYQVETEMNIKEGLDKKTKTALQKSIIEETKKRITGGNLHYDSSSSDEEENKKKTEFQEGNIMNVYSEIIKNKITRKFQVVTTMEIKECLNKKIKNTLLKSILNENEKKITF